MCSLARADAVLVGLAVREARASAPGVGLCGRRPSASTGQPRGHVRRVARQHLGDARGVVEADERVGDDEAALGQARARPPAAARSARARRRGRSRGSRRRAARGDLVLGLVERHQARARADEAVPSEAALLDRLEQEAGARARAQPQVGPERGDQIGVDVGACGHGSTKRPSWRGSTSGAGCEDASGLAGDAPAPLAAPGPPGADGSGHLLGA